MESNLLELQPYTVKDGVTYHFGIEEISVEKQALLISEAIQKFGMTATPGLYDQTEKYDTATGTYVLADPVGFRKSGRHKGYCKSSCCRNDTGGGDKPPAHAATCGVNILYNCLNCLSKHLKTSRMNSEGMIVDVVFVNTDSELATDLQPRHMENKSHKNAMVLTFHEHHLTIGKDNHKYPYRYLAPIQDDLNVMILIHGRYRDLKYQKFYTACVHGKHACEQIMRGKTCVSLSGEFEEKFQTATVPPGVPGWVEKHDGDDKGMIVTRRFCYPCAVQFNKHASKSAKTSPTKEPISPRGMDEKTRKLFTQIHELQNSLHEKDIQIYILQQLLDEHGISYKQVCK